MTTISNNVSGTRGDKEDADDSEHNGKEITI